MRRLSRAMRQSRGGRPASTLARGLPDAGASLPQGISEVPLGAGWGEAIIAAEDRKRVNPVTYPIDLDVGDVADGYHLIVRSISLTDNALLFDFAFLPEVPEERRGELWPNMNYGADVEPPGWNQACSEGEEYERPVPQAKQAWFDFFRPDFVWMGHFDRRGKPDSDYMLNRIARLTFDLKTGQAQIET